MKCLRAAGFALVVALGVLAGSITVTAQDSKADESDPSQARNEYPRVGGEVGLTYVMQKGEFAAGCGRFTDGSRINLFFAGAYDIPLPPYDKPGFRVEGLLGYQTRTLSGTYASHEASEIETMNGADSSIVAANVDYDNTGKLTLGYIMLMPSFKAYIAKGFYGGVGFNLGLLASATSQYSKTITSKTVQVSPTVRSEIFYPQAESSDPYTKTFAEEKRDDASAITFDGVVYLGYEIRITRKIKASVRGLYTLPFTSVFKDPELKLSTVQLLFGMRFNLFDPKP